MTDTWRIVLRDGAVLRVFVDPYGVLRFAHSTTEALARAPIAEVLAPGELTRSEAVAAEREACARAAEEHLLPPAPDDLPETRTLDDVAAAIAAQIRARGGDRG